MRPALDTPRSARYLVPATHHVAAITLRTAVTDADRPLIAAKLATGFRPGDADDTTMREAVARIRRHAIDTARRLAATVTSRRLDAIVDVAVALQQALVSQPDADRACVGVAVVREFFAQKVFRQRSGYYA